MPTPRSQRSYWLIKSEGDCYSIDDLRRDRRTAWTGIRNYQARNYMRDMKPGDLLLFYHSMADPTGIYGIAKVASAPYADPTALDPKDEHYDPKRPWVCVDVAFVKKLAAPVSLAEIKADPALRHMLVARRGQRLSVMPVEEAHFKKVEAM
ncbi:MAG: EVE domain-containing protein [Patescibacteria group bacterium]|nr:EVE domain-containing protein [Patescibacteria group bacterium]